MLRQLLGKLLNLNKSNGSRHRPYRSSSDDYRRHQRGDKYMKHNEYGHSHYKKKRSSSSYSS
ncbi:hypothetical protein [Paenibacillus xerothermodurans]|uniref:Uncharacterized protein n=1 Tax=Paenibacillus xerothermodurans TaxID=1977292 RepID=A0A2W1NZ93_PAEXE|nr:hypothetical protein [Paenibacillus xerothermodurans]PZE20168.1 hypothetical protein CBW46_014865 [Paenibacillus xerothermodurans]